MKRDPIKLQTAKLKEQYQVSDERLAAINAGVERELDEAWAYAEAAPYSRTGDRHATYLCRMLRSGGAEKMETKNMTYMQAVRLALDEEFARDEKVIMMGQDIGILGGAYGVTGDLYHKYGPDRVIDAPLAENAIVGFGIGAAMTGWRPIIDIMKMDFSMVCVDPIINHLAKYRYMSGGQDPEDACRGPDSHRRHP